MRQHLFDSTTNRCDHCGVDYFTVQRNRGNWPCEPVILRNRTFNIDAEIEKRGGREHVTAECVKHNSFLQSLLK